MIKENAITLVSLFVIFCTHFYDKLLSFSKTIKASQLYVDVTDMFYRQRPTYADMLTGQKLFA